MVYVDRLEALVYSAVYLKGIVRDKLDQLRWCFEVQFAAGRDLRPEQVNGRNASQLHSILQSLDEVLYSLGIGMPIIVDKFLTDFLAIKCGMSIEQASSLRADLFQKHGSSLAGLMHLGYDVHPDEYHSFVHGLLPYERIRPDPQLRELLRTIPQAKIMFTNSDRKHVSRVLERLGIEEECFDGIICFETLNSVLYEPRPASATLRQPPTVVLKPFIAAFEAAIAIAGFEPHRTLFLDDSEKNIRAGKIAGLHTALVGRTTRIAEADYVAENTMCLRQIIPEIWGMRASESEMSGGGSDSELGGGLRMRNELDGIMRPITARIQA
ncbi:COP9 signalosome complex subunit 7 [Platanthera zijinensis]|uniref:COP9 signalosome complex subunit 7 n=1 Tax=Platanthera zijinensis TaxID=2320716 RepID=A0AAP0GAT8_9ASPA